MSHSSRPPSPNPLPPTAALDDPSRSLAPTSSEMTSKAEAEVGTPSPDSLPPRPISPSPTPAPTTAPPAGPTIHPFAFGSTGSDSSSAASSIRESLDDVRPVTRRDLPDVDTFAARRAQAVHAQDFAFQPFQPAAESDSDRGGSPVSIDLPVLGGHTTQQMREREREVRWQLPDPTSARPDTVDSEKDLPQRQFFPESSDNSDKFDDEEDGADNVFAFNRPPTAPQAGVTASDSTIPTTSSLHANMLEPAPIAGYDADHNRFYDPSHPPPYSGRSNLNNGVFAFSYGMRKRHDSSQPSTGVGRFPPTTASTMMTDLSSDGLERQQPTLDHGAPFMRMPSQRPPTGRPSTGRPSTGRPSTMASTYMTESEWTEDGESQYRPRTRDSRAVTELSGDATVPDGVTTWGDGLGGELKTNSDQDTSEAQWYEEDSPYAEVRASVSNLDDPEMPALTLRSWCLGMFLVVVAAAANTFFSFRNPTPTIPILVVQVVAYPLGRFLAWVLPIRDFTMPSWLGGFTFSLNPCPFNVKEHTVIVMMANVAIMPAFGMSSLVVSEVWYHQPLSLGFSFMYILASQLTGLSMAGIARRFVVWPASMIWPGVLVMTTNLNTLHAEADPGSGSMTRLRFFIIAGTAAFAYYFLPGFLFQGLSYFSYICWAAPNNPVVNQLFGVSTGLGMGILNFDWAQIAWTGSPLANPWWAQVNIAIGFFLFYWIIVPILYYTNAWYTKHLPIMSVQAADRFGEIYNVTKLLTPEYTLNTTAYKEYSPVYLTATFTMTYMLAYALTTSLIVYTVLIHGKRLVQTIRRMQVEPDDIHLKLMRVYPEVPDWWYVAALAVCLVLGIVTVEVFPTTLPVWGYLVAVVMAFIYILPAAIMYALSNLEPAVNLIAELIPGFAFQGRPLAGMIFKTFAVQTLVEALYFVRDMKIGHYMKVPPRSMFVAQMSACAIACFVQVGVKTWMFSTIPDMCSIHQKDLLICSSQRTSYSASIIWGLIGPERLFSKGGIYNPQLWMMLVGALLPFPFWLWCRRYPRSIVRNINVCVIFCVCLFTPPASGINVASFLFVGFIFQYWVRRYRFAWWSKYNYVLSAALDVGTLISGLFIFLTIRLPGAKLNWWGNSVYKNTMDWQGSARSATTPPEGFGPNTWKV